MNRSKTTDSTLGAKSLSDMSVSGKDVFAVPAKPVYTSADREKSAAASSANTTDTELARLYDYVQLMPESSEKRRLVKKFNKLNEQG